MLISFWHQTGNLQILETTALKHFLTKQLWCIDLAFCKQPNHPLQYPQPYLFFYSAVPCATWRVDMKMLRKPKMQCEFTLACQSWWNFCIHLLAGHSSKQLLVSCVIWHYAPLITHPSVSMEVCLSLFNWWWEPIRICRGDRDRVW